MKNILLRSFLMLIALLVAQLCCYYILDEILRHFMVSIYNSVLLRLILAGVIYILLDIVLIHKKLDKGRGTALIVLYVLFILALTMRPLMYQSYNIRPFAWLSLLGDSNQILLLLGNSMLYIPIGIFIFYLAKGKKLEYLIIGVVLILLLKEVCQYVFLLGVFDIDHVLLNLLGIWFGYVYAKMFLLTEQVGVRC